MRLAVCDDDPRDLGCICDLAMQYDKNISVRAFSTARALYECREAFDAVILDIEMEPPNGFEIAQRMARDEQHPIILFVTNSAAYAVRGYGLALRYLLKPLTFEALAQALDAVRAELGRSRVSFCVDGVTHVLQVPQIHYAEVAGHRVTLHTATGPLTLRGSLKELADALPGRWFCAPHQSYIVNLLHVRAVVGATVHLDDGTVIPISRRRQGQFLQAFYALMGVDV